MENIEIKNKDILLNLNENEEIVYVAEQNKGEFYCFAPFIVLFGVPLFSFFLIASFFTTMKSSWLIYIIWFVLMSLSYIYIRDYFFTEIILTNQRLIISRFNKLFCVDFNQIKAIWGFPLANAPTTANILVKPKKTYRISFINRLKLENKFNELYPEYTSSIKIGGKGSKLSWALCIMFLVAMFYIVIRFHPTH